MPYGVIGLLSQVATAALIVSLVYATRASVGRALGIRGLRLTRSGETLDFEHARRWAVPALVAAQLAAGYLLCAAPFFAASWSGGETRQLLDGTIRVIEGRAAAAAGLLDGDRIVSVGGAPTATFQDVAARVAAHPGEPVDVEVERAGQRVHFNVTPASEGGKGKIGVTAMTTKAEAPFGAALVRGLGEPALTLRSIASGTLETLGGRSAGEISGPIGIVREVSARNESHVADLLFLLGVVTTYYGLPLTLILAIVLRPMRRKEPRDTKA